MKHCKFISLLWMIAALVSLESVAADPAATSLKRTQYDVAGTAREALIYAPAAATTNKTAVVFIFHGHGGTAEQAARSFAMEKQWPEVICVYMQGLKTPGRLTDPEGKRNGWQQRKGHMDDRDLKFFDAVMEALRKDYKVDRDRIYCTGHSNGGAFTYLLWAERGSLLAAVAPSAAAFGVLGTTDLQPKPAMHLAGTGDTLVKYEWQQLTMKAIRKVNGCDEQGKQWAPNCTLYPSQKGTPVVTYIHPGGHTFQPEAPALIVKFFKSHPIKK